MNTSSNQPQNPYQASSNADEANVVETRANPTAGVFANCPSCRGSNATKVGWTFWGGAIGPRMLSHVECNSCKTKYNGKTGGYNTIGIVIYLAVSAAIGIGGYVVLWAT
jgi:hypothetical protein